MTQIIYDAIEVTQGRNGYPQGLYHATAGFATWEEAENYAHENDGTLVLLHRKDGWQLWEKKGNLFEQPTRTAEDEGDDYELLANEDKASLLERMKEEIADNGDTFEDIQSIMDEYEKIFDAIDDTEEGEAVLVKYGTIVVDTIELRPMQWHDTDNNQYMVAVVE